MTTGLSCTRWSKAVRNGAHPRRTPCPARNQRPGRVLGGIDRHRNPAGAGRAAHRGRGSVRREFVPRPTFDEARQVTLPLHVLLQWDDEGNDRRLALDLFDAFGSREKTLQANMGGHTGVPSFAGDDAARFFARHLK